MVGSFFSKGCNEAKTWCLSGPTSSTRPRVIKKWTSDDHKTRISLVALPDPRTDQSLGAQSFYAAVPMHKKKFHIHVPFLGPFKTCLVLLALVELRVSFGSISSILRFLQGNTRQIINLNFWRAMYTP